MKTVEEDESILKHGKLTEASTKGQSDSEGQILSFFMRCFHSELLYNVTITT